MIRFLLAFICACTCATAEENVVLGMSQNRVSITANFDGSEILVFGAVKRETAIPDGAPLQVIVTISGPKEPIIVRRKDKRFGIWVNTESVTVDEAPSFYAIATSAPFSEIISNVEDLRHEISVRESIRLVGAEEIEGDAQDFAEAVVRIREDNGLYALLENSVDVAEQTLFRTAIEMPANLTEGDYRTRVYLLRDKAVVSVYETTLDVRKVGLERWLYNLSRQQPLIYGLLSLAIAIAAGWGASAFFRVIRQGP